MVELRVKEIPKELILVKQFIDDGKNDEAFQVIKSFEEISERTLHEIVSCHLLNCELLFQQGLYEDNYPIKRINHLLYFFF